jgi:hypothetical protein
MIVVDLSSHASGVDVERDLGLKVSFNIVL